MDQESQETLQRILATPEEDLNETEKDFLRARRGYLKPSEKEDFPNVLAGLDDGRETKPKKNKGRTQYSSPTGQTAKAPASATTVSPALDQAVGSGVNSTPVDQQATVPQVQPCLDPDCTHEEHPERAPQV